MHPILHKITPLAALVVNKVWNLLRRFRLAGAALVLLCLPIILYFWPCSIPFEAEICTYNFKWRNLNNESVDKNFVEDLPVSDLMIEGAQRLNDYQPIRIADNAVIRLAEPSPAFYIKKIRLPPQIEIRIKLASRKTSNQSQATARHVLSIVLNTLSPGLKEGVDLYVGHKQSTELPWYVLVDNLRMLLNKQVVKISGHSMRLTAQLPALERGDVFGGLPMRVQPGSMIFIEGEWEEVSTILSGHLWLGGYKQPESDRKSITIDSGQYLSLGEPGIEGLVDLKLGTTDQANSQDCNGLIVRVEGYTKALKIGPDSYEFRCLEKYLGPEPAKQLMLAAAGAILGLLVYVIREQLKATRRKTG